MLRGLQKEIRRIEQSDVMADLMTFSSTPDSIKGAFLDDIELALVGAENDPEIANLIESVPEYDDYDEEVELEVENLTENLMETEI